MDGWWSTKERSWEEELPFDLLLKVKTLPPFIGLGNPKSVNDCNNSIAECTGPWNLDAATDVLDFIEAASCKASALCHQEVINNCPVAAKDLLICRL